MFVALVTCNAVAQEQPVPVAPPASAPAVTTEPAPVDALTVPAELAAGTMIEIRIEEPVNSKTHKTGDWYALSLSQPVMLGDALLIPAGTPGRGQVVHSARSGWGGKAGELILAARYLEFEGRQIPLRGMKLGGVGGNNEGLAFGATVAGGLVAMPLVFALNGKNADIPAGLLATAKLAEALPRKNAAQPSASEEAASADTIAQDALAPATDTSSTTEMGEPK
jgi:hypothetical protein